MFKKKPNRQDRWEPMADVFSALTLIFMLILLLMLSTWISDSYYDGTQDVEVRPYWVEHGNDHNNNSGRYWDETRETEPSNGGGGGESTRATEPLEPTEPTERVIREEAGKAAVKVMMVDSESGELIQEEGAAFYLQGSDRIKRTLYTYYPKMAAYNLFETQADGAFFLPEKLEKNSFTIYNTKAPAGYVGGNSVSFTIDRDYEWGSPLIVRFPLDPIRQTIRIQTVDSETRKALSGCTFQVVTNKTLIRPDGTVFAENGQVLDTIVCDRSGNGESKELTVTDSIELRQVAAPRGYIISQNPIAVSVGSATSEGKPIVQEIPVQQAKAVVSVQDEYTKTKLQGVKFTVSTSQNESVSTLVTDENGQITLERLEKGTDYTLTQSSWAQGYQPNPASVELHVDENGYINSQEKVNYLVSNRIIRVKVDCGDWLNGARLNHVVVRLLDENGNLATQDVNQNVSSAMTGIEPGTYTIQVDGNEHYILSQNKIQVRDVPEIQRFTIRVFTRGGLIALISVIAALVVIAVWAIARLIITNRKRRRIGRRK